MSALAQQLSSDIKEGGHSCPPIKYSGGLENQPSVAGDGQGFEEDSGENRGVNAVTTQLPKEWQTLALEKTGDVVYGIQAAVANNVEPIGTKILTNKNITLDGQFDLDKLNYFELTTPRHKATILKSGDILFNWRSGSIDHVGKTAIFRLPGEYVHSSFILRIRPFNTVSNDYLFYHLRFLRESGYYARMHTYAINAKFNKSAVNALPVVLPPLPEQKKIAHILLTVQRAIEAQERTIQTTTELKKALMHKLFTEGLRNEPQKQTEIGLVPESWEVVRCEDVCNTISVGIVVKPTQYYVPTGVPALRSQNVRIDRMQMEPMVYISEEANNGLVTKSKLRSGDVLIVRTGANLGMSCVLPAELDGCNCIDLLFIRTKPDRLNGNFLSRFINSEEAKKQVGAGKTGMAQPHFNVGTVRRIFIPLPPLKEQNEIVSCLEKVDQKHNLATSKRYTLQDLFRTLLHELMTAKTRTHNLILGIK